MPEFHALEPKEVLAALDSHDRGITPEQAQLRLEESGPNELRREKGQSSLGLFLEQFRDFLIIILIAAALVSMAIGEVLDAMVILVIVVINAIVGFVQGYRAEKSLEALKKMTSPTARVVRNGEEMKIPAVELVPGDVILLEAGDRVPSDARLLEALEIRVDEAALTGESLPVDKSVEKIKAGAPLADRVNMVYAGTVIVYGKGRAVVTETGMNTELGRIASMVQATEREDTPLQKRLEVVGKQLGLMILGICAVVFVVGIIRVGPTPEHITFMFLAAVSLAVAAIPEGLPAVVTMALALGTQRMAREKAVIRKLPAVETLGSCDVICSDKTGTFTKNEMTVKRIYIDGRELEVTGSGYDIDGVVLDRGKAVDVNGFEGLATLVRGSVLCNNASLESGMGDPTELALLVLGQKASMEKRRLEESHTRVREVQFDSERKRMSTVHVCKGSSCVYTKGAAEVVLNLCDRVYQNGKAVKLTAADRRRIAEKNDELADRALRVLGIAYKEIKKGEKEVEKDLVFLGLVGMMDPPRPEVKAAVESCKAAGIAVKMITGDHAVTARAIAREVGLPEGEVITGEELGRMSDEELRKRVEHISVFARVNPEHKLRIVDALKSNGHIVAMTGDGVNDAPALKKADIGVAMGITGTEVTKEAGSMILMDDNFATIVSAVEEGRGIYDNIKKFIMFLLSCNIGEVLVIFLGILLFPIKETVLMPAQILWMNLVTDGMPALALGVDPKEGDVMRRPPRPAKDRIFSGLVLKNIIIVGIVIAAGTLGVYYMYNPGFESEGQVAMKAGTMAFTTIVTFELVNAFNCRSEKGSLFKVGFFKNKWLLLAIGASFLLQVMVIYTPGISDAFNTVPLGLYDWAVVIVVSLSVFAAVEAFKYFERNKRGTKRRG
jgi:Ca2+-transporting ATPase